MILKSINRRFLTFIKLVSIVLISSAIGLELWNLYAVWTNKNIPSILNPVFWVERLAIAAHLVEAVIAAFYAPSRKKMPIQYGTYTFFVGTVALLELFDN